MLKQKSILQAGSQESVFYKLIDGLESALKASVSGFIKFLRIRARGYFKQQDAALLCWSYNAASGLNFIAA